MLDTDCKNLNSIFKLFLAAQSGRKQNLRFRRVNRLFRLQLVSSTNLMLASYLHAEFLEFLVQCFSFLFVHQDNQKFGVKDILLRRAFQQVREGRGNGRGKEEVLQNVNFNFTNFFIITPFKAFTYLS